MRKIILSLFLLGGMIAPAQAQLISPQPHCAVFRNDTDSYILGSIRTAYGTDRAGQKYRHESSFRLEAGAKNEACSTGPFYPGYQIEFVIKTMIPIFTCKTALKGTISITSKRDEEGRYKYAATCVAPSNFPY